MAHGSPQTGQIIRQLRKQAQMTQDALAQAIGCSVPQLSLMESGQRTISLTRARAIQDALNINDDRIIKALQWEHVPPELREQVTSSQQASHKLAAQLKEALATPGDVQAALTKLRRLVEQNAVNIDDPLPLHRQIPVINRVAAGYPVEFTDLDYPASIADEYVACPDVTDPSAFAARVVGDSMEPDYREGEIVVFSPSLPTPSGSDCFIRLERDQETTFKRVFFDDEEDTIRLQPLNNTYSPRFVVREDIAGIYAAAYVMRQVGNT